MFKYSKMIASTALALFLAEATWANIQTTESCVAALTPTGKVVYDVVAPSVEANSNLKKLLKKKVRPLVFDGTLKRKVAKANARQAGECLRLLQQEKITNFQSP